MGRRNNSYKKRRSAVAALEATMNITLGHSANSERKIRISNETGRSEPRFPKSMSSPNLNITISSKHADLEEEEEESFDGEHKGNTNELKHHVMQSNANHLPTAADDPKASCFSFPYDVWELIGKYITPETVITFGSICKDSYTVINQPSFWLKLQRDFGPFDIINLCQRRGLKSRVIRSLYLHYLPFSRRLDSPKAKITDPHTLVGLTCLQYDWSKIDCNHGTRSFRFDIQFGKLNPSIPMWKLQQTNRCQKNININEDNKDIEDFEELIDNDTFDFGTNLDDYVSDIHVNLEEYNTVLRLESSSFRPGLPDTVMGMKLQNVCMTATGPGFRYQKLVLKFVPRHIGLKQCSSELVTVDIGDINSVKILKWYHPGYPTSIL